MKYAVDPRSLAFHNGFFARAFDAMTTTTSDPQAPILQQAETELKYQLQHDQVAPLCAWLNEHAMQVGKKQLENLYFDTESKELAQHKIGLRIRRWPGGAEQTVKLPGRQQGALSSRPEYNLPTTAAIPDLTRFPADIWPASVRPDELTARLQLQFEVSFERHYWLWDEAETLIEIVFDQGVIRARGREEAILELELELKKGSEAALIKIAQRIATQFSLEAGTRSKAQRGYALLEGDPC